MLIVDGGLGLELERRGFVASTTLWSGEAIIAEPDLLAAVHRDYLVAGANVIETATYQLSHAALRTLGYDDRAIDGVFARAVQIARDAIAAHLNGNRSGRAAIVAGSLGPYGATLGDGSEYSAVPYLELDQLYAFHAERARALARAGPDVIIFETIPSLREALVIARVARDLHLHRVWLSFACPDGSHTYAGDEIGTAAAQLEPVRAIEAVGVNCTAPASTAPLVRKLKGVTSKALFACPNVGQHWEADTHALAGGESDAAFLGFVPEWLGLGVTYLGGCCGVRPRTIEALAMLAAPSMHNAVDFLPP